METWRSAVLGMLPCNEVCVGAPAVGHAQGVQRVQRDDHCCYQMPNIDFLGKLGLKIKWFLTFL